MAIYKGDTADLWRPVKGSSGQKPTKESYASVKSGFDCRFHEIKSDRRIALGLSTVGDMAEVCVALPTLDECDVDYIFYHIELEEFWRVSAPVLRVRHPKGHWQAVLSKMGMPPAYLREHYGV